MGLTIDTINTRTSSVTVSQQGANGTELGGLSQANGVASVTFNGVTTELSKEGTSAMFTEFVQYTKAENPEDLNKVKRFSTKFQKPLIG